VDERKGIEKNGKEKYNMILSARVIKRPRTDKVRYCAECEWPISGTQLRLYGMAEAEEKPYSLYFHPRCVQRNIKDEPKIIEALKNLESE
jgi:hypothetical protein